MSLLLYELGYNYYIGKVFYGIYDNNYMYGACLWEYTDTCKRTQMTYSQRK